MKNPGDASVFMMLNELAHLGRYEAAKRMENLGLKPSQAGILFILNCHGRMSQRKLADEIGITPPSMTVALRKLEERNLVAKVPDEKDQRVINIELSDNGKACVEKLKGIMSEMESTLYRGMTPEEKMLLRRLLLDMRKNLLDSKEFRGMDMRSIMQKTRPPIKHEFQQFLE